MAELKEQKEMLGYFNTQEKRLQMIESQLKSMTASGLKLINLPALFIEDYTAMPTGNRKKE